MKTRIIKRDIISNNVQNQSKSTSQASVKQILQAYKNKFSSRANYLLQKKINNSIIQCDKYWETNANWKVENKNNPLAADPVKKGNYIKRVGNGIHELFDTIDEAQNAAFNQLNWIPETSTERTQLAPPPSAGLYKYNVNQEFPQIPTTLKQDTSTLVCHDQDPNATLIKVNIPKNNANQIITGNLQSVAHFHAGITPKDKNIGNIYKNNNMPGYDLVNGSAEHYFKNPF